MKPNWLLLTSVCVTMAALTVAVIFLKINVIRLILPLIVVGLMLYLLYGFLLSLGYGDKETKGTTDEQPKN